jgi:hypothetical protein
VSHRFPRRGPAIRRLLVAPLSLALAASMLLAAPVAATGELVWADQFSYFGRAVTATPNAVYVAAGGSFLIKYSHAGVPQWERSLGAGAVIEALAWDESGVYAAGVTTIALPGQPDPRGRHEFFVASYAPDGALTWARQFFLPALGDAYPGHIRTWLKTTPAGVFIAGNGLATSFLRLYDRDGNTRWTQNVPAHADAMTADGSGAVVVSTRYGLSTPTMRKFDNAGALRFSQPTTGVIHVAAPGPGGAFYVAYVDVATTAPLTEHGQLTVYDTNGRRLRTHRLGGEHFLEWGGITAYGGRLYVTWTETIASGPVGRWAALSPTTGSVIWHHDFALVPGSRIFPTSISVVGQGGYIAGRLDGALAGHTAAEGSAFLVKFGIDARPPNILESGYALPPRVPLTFDDFTLEGSWKAADDISGVGRIQLQQSSDGTNWSDIQLSEPAPTSALIDVKPNGPHRFRVRAIDRSGNVGKWSVSRLYQTDLLQETDSALTYDTDWKPATMAGANGGSVMTTSTAGATAKLDFTGDAVGLVATRGPDRGAVAVYLDGVKLKTLDLKAPAPSTNLMVFARNFASVGPHLLTLVAVGTPGRPTVDIDAFEIRSTSP